MNSLKPTRGALRALPTECRVRARPKCICNRSLLSSYYPSRSLTSTSSRTVPSPPPQIPKNPIDPIALHRLESERRAYYRRRSYYSAAGFVGGMIAIWLIATSIDLPPKPTKLDSPSIDIPIDKRKENPLVALGRERKTVVQKLGEEADEEGDVVQTGTSTVPTFPRLLAFADGTESRDVGSGVTEDGLIEYQLVGWGIRTVSFLKIQVYVVGMYVATDDIAALHEALIRRIDPVATTLVAGEKEKLKQLLLDPEQGEAIWSKILRGSSVRTVVRIVPTRDTDFGHLRDGWVRLMTGRARKNPEEFGDDAFGASVNNFKALFRKGSVLKKKELLLARNEKGVLAVWYDDGKGSPQRLGDVQDERISRAVWLNYLAGKTVASEPARASIVEGVMEFVEGPVGTVATQVHA
jgi:hypothetical protein